MAKIKSSVVFKTYNQQQAFLLPPSLDELISPRHLVRVVNEVVESIDITELMNQYQGGGTSSYHPRMLLKVLLYSYSVKIYTGRKIAKALSQDIHFMWLSGMSRPDFRTINNFRSSKAKEVIEVLFKEMLEFLFEHQYIKMENYFCDGTTLAANANKNKMVWKRNAERYKAIAERKCEELFSRIDELNASEDNQYGNEDLEEHGTKSEITREAIQHQVNKLTERIKSVTNKKEKRRTQKLKKELQEVTHRMDKYDGQLSKSGNRGGYNKTDEDASGMRMKNQEVLPAYNVMAGCEDQFITGVSIHQNTNDSVCFRDHMEEVAQQQPLTPQNVIADSIMGTEQNYELLATLEVGNFVKFPTFHSEKKRSNKNNRFLKGNFPYDPQTDTFTCPNHQELIFTTSHQITNKRTGYQSQIKSYECRSCAGCPFYNDCCKSCNGGNRSIQINEKLEAFKNQARENLNSENGIKLGKQRSIEIESCFGDIKHNMGFRRFHLRGLKKVKTEITLVAMAHNLRKIHIKTLKKAA